MKKIGNGVLLTLYALTVILPLVWIVVGSFKTNTELFASPWALPKSPQFGNFAQAWTAVGGSSFWNSVIATFGTLAILLPVGAMAAYIFAKYPFRGSKALFTLVLGGMMFPNFLVVIPLFILLRDAGLKDTMSGLIIAYVAYSLSFTIFVLTGFFQALPNELAEAAQIDGCGHNATFWRIMLPLARPGIIVVGLFNGIGLWNEFPLAKVLLSENRTLPLGIADLAMNQNYKADWATLFAGMVLVMLPVLVIYWIFREKIQEAMVAGAVKG